MKKVTICLMTSLAAIVLSFLLLGNNVSYAFQLKIVGPSNWYCLESKGYQKPVELEECRYARDDEWYIDNEGRIQSWSDGLCLEVTGGAHIGGIVEARPCHGGLSQKWTVIGSEIKAFSGSDFCLDVPARRFESGQRLQIWPCNRTSEQKWSLGHINITTAKLSNHLNWGLNVDPSTGDAVIENDGLPNEWYYDEKGRLHDTNLWPNANDYCLDKPWWTELYTHRCHDGINQRWGFTEGEIRAYGRSEYCVDVPRQNFENGQAVQIYPCNRTIAQKWIIY